MNNCKHAHVWAFSQDEFVMEHPWREGDEWYADYEDRAFSKQVEVWIECVNCGEILSKEVRFI